MIHEALIGNTTGTAYRNAQQGSIGARISITSSTGLNGPQVGNTSGIACRIPCSQRLSVTRYCKKDTNKLSGDKKTNSIHPTCRVIDDYVFVFISVRHLRARVLTSLRRDRMALWAQPVTCVIFWCHWWNAKTQKWGRRSSMGSAISIQQSSSE